MFNPRNDATLLHLVDRYLSSRLETLLQLRGLQVFQTDEADCAIAAQRLRDYWVANPRAVWRDGLERGEEPEDFWSPELLIEELDRRAESAADEIAQSRGTTRGGTP